MGNEQSCSKDTVDIKQITQNEHYNISVVGRMNSGKSSLLNIFLNSNLLLPVKAMRETSTVVKIIHHDKINSELIIDHNGSRCERVIDTNHGEINKALTKINKDARSMASNINLTLHSKLKFINTNNIILYDTPGLAERLDHITEKIIKISNIVLFLMDISTISEINNIKYYKKIYDSMSSDKYKKIYIILTHIDNDIEKLLSEWKDEVVNDFKQSGITIDKNNVIPISIKTYNETYDLNTSNVDELIKKLNDDITQSKNEYIEKYLFNFLAQIQFNNNKIPNNLITNPKIILPKSFKRQYQQYNETHIKVSAITGAIGGCALAGGIALAIAAPPLGVAAVASLAAAETGMLVGAGALITTSILSGYESSNVKKMLQEKEQINNFDKYEYNDILYNDDDTNKIYDGGFKGGRYHGYGMLYYSNGNICVQGKFCDGYLIEAFEIYDRLGRAIFHGSCKNIANINSNEIKANGVWYKYDEGIKKSIEIKIEKEIDTKYKYTTIKFLPFVKREIIPRMDPFNLEPTKWKINSGDNITVKNYYYDDWYRICVGDNRGYIKIIKNANAINSEYTININADYIDFKLAN